MKKTRLVLSVDGYLAEVEAVRLLNGLHEWANAHNLPRVKFQAELVEIIDRGEV